MHGNPGKEPHFNSCGRNDGKICEEEIGNDPLTLEKPTNIYFEDTTK